jgi:hypothetical protein
MISEDRRDLVPFGDGTELSVVFTPRNLSAAEAEARRTVENNFVAWGQHRGFVRAGSFLEGAVDGVFFRLPIYEVYAETAVIQATAARRPLRLSMAIAPSTWVNRLEKRFGTRRHVTGDAAFDAEWCVTASDEALARRLVDARCRAALQATRGTTVTYEEGTIALRVVGERLCGADVLRGVEIAVALASVQVSYAAYR